MNLYTITCAPTAAGVAVVGASHSPGAGAILIDGSAATAGVATLGAAQKITLVSGGNDTGVTFTITGTDADSLAQTEAVVGANAGTATGTKYFKTVTGVTASGAVATTLSLGCAIASVSPTFLWTKQAQPALVTVAVVLNSGTATFELQDSFTAGVTSGQQLGTWIQNATVNAKSATLAFAYGDFIPFATRLSLSASSSGNVSANFVATRR